MMNNGNRRFTKVLSAALLIASMAATPMLMTGCGKVEAASSVSGSYEESYASDDSSIEGNSISSYGSEYEDSGPVYDDAFYANLEKDDAYESFEAYEDDSEYNCSPDISYESESGAAGQPSEESEESEDQSAEKETDEAANNNYGISSDKESPETNTVDDRVEIELRSAAADTEQASVEARFTAPAGAEIEAVGCRFGDGTIQIDEDLQAGPYKESEFSSVFTMSTPDGGFPSGKSYNYEVYAICGGQEYSVGTQSFTAPLR